MPYIYACVDTNIFFTKDVYYIKFKGHEMKYLPGARKDEKDRIILKQDFSRTSEAYELFNEFFSALACSWNCVFDFDLVFSKELHVNWDKINDALSNQTREISAYTRLDDFIMIHPLKNEQEVKMASLYRIAKLAKPIYSKVLFLWHCVCFGENNENLSVDKLAVFLKDKVDGQALLNNPIMTKVNIAEEDKYNCPAQYIKECIRHAIAHIERRETSRGRSMSIVSLDEIQHFYTVSDILEKYVRYKIENVLEMKRPDDLNYLSYFVPDHLRTNN